MCNCISEINKALKERNLTLVTNLAFIERDGRVDCTCLIPIATELIEKKRGQKPTGMLPKYCPFCAEKIDYGKKKDVGECE